MLKIHPQRNLI